VEGEFPASERDPIITIAVSVSVYGKPEETVNTIIQLDGCDAVEGATVISASSEVRQRESGRADERRGERRRDELGRTGIEKRRGRGRERQPTRSPVICKYLYTAHMFLIRGPTLPDNPVLFSRLSPASLRSSSTSRGFSTERTQTSSQGTFSQRTPW
jgi:hypothetical protein